MKVTKAVADPKEPSTDRKRLEVSSQESNEDTEPTASHSENETEESVDSEQASIFESSVKVKEDEKDTVPTQNDTPAYDPVAYQQYYQQYYQSAYMQQYQQYYSQYSGQTGSYDPTNDPIYAHYAESATSSIPTFDQQRAGRQMAYYFDPSKHTAVLSPEMQAARAQEKQQLQARLTSKEIQAFKKKKQELKKKRNQWFYE